MEERKKKQTREMRMRSTDRCHVHLPIHRACTVCATTLSLLSVKVHITEGEVYLVQASLQDLASTISSAIVHKQVTV